MHESSKNFPLGKTSNMLILIWLLLRMSSARLFFFRKNLKYANTNISASIHEFSKPLPYDCFDRWVQQDLCFSKNLKYADITMTASLHEFSKIFPAGKISHRQILIWLLLQHEFSKTFPLGKISNMPYTNMTASMDELSKTNSYNYHTISTGTRHYYLYSGLK